MSTAYFPVGFASLDPLEMDIHDLVIDRAAALIDYTPNHTVAVTLKYCETGQANGRRYTASLGTYDGSTIICELIRTPEYATKLQALNQLRKEVTDTKKCLAKIKGILHDCLGRGVLVTIQVDVYRHKHVYFDAKIECFDDATHAFDHITLAVRYQPDFMSALHSAYKLVVDSKDDLRPQTPSGTLGSSG